MDKYANGDITEIESWDITFLEHDFPSTGEISKDYHLYEMEDLNDIKILNMKTHENIVVPQSLILSESDINISLES